MSAPAPFTVNVLFAKLALPRVPIGAPGPPMSWLTHGAGRPLVLENAVTTLSKVAVFNLDVSWLVTARPARSDEGSEGSVTAPIVVHTDPFGDTAAVICKPARVSLSHTGAGVDAPAMNVVADP